MSSTLRRADPDPHQMAHVETRIINRRLVQPEQEIFRPKCTPCREIAQARISHVDRAKTLITIAGQHTLSSEKISIETCSEHQCQLAVDSCQILKVLNRSSISPRERPISQICKSQRVVTSSLFLASRAASVEPVVSDDRRPGCLFLFSDNESLAFTLPA